MYYDSYIELLFRRKGYMTKYSFSFSKVKDYIVAVKWSKSTG